MKYLNYMKAGDSESPAFIIILYYLFFTLDLVTTYLASPDLKYEGNWIFNYVNFNFIQFFIFYLIVVLLVTLGYLIALNYFHNYFKVIGINKRISFSSIFFNIKILLSFIMLGCFYSHLINLGHIIINNYLGLIYIYGIENILSKTSTWYVSKQPFFHLYIQTIPILIGYIIAYFRIRRIRNKYRSIA